MADNIIQKIVKLILDRDSAQNTEKDAKKALGGIDGALESLKERAKHLAEALAAAFALHKLFEFGKSAVEMAMEAQKTWSSLAATVDATGVSFASLAPIIRKSADAFAAATIHDDDSYAMALQRLIVVTGDVEASLHNMGMVANVAAAFFGGDLASAAELVAKVMNGNVGMLSRMGIEAKNAQEGLEILASRSMGAATREANTMGGQMHQLNNEWDDFKKALGAAVIGTNAAHSGMGMLRAAVKEMLEWVDKNKDAIREWVKDGINFAIISADVLFRSITGMSLILMGAFHVGLGIAADGLAALANGYVAAVQGAALLAPFFGGSKEDSDNLREHAASIRATADALKEWAHAAIMGGSDEVAKGLNRLATPVFTPPTSAPRGAAPLDVQAPEAAREHQTELDKMSKFDVDYWKKRIRLTHASITGIKAAEKGLTTHLLSEFTVRQEAAASLAGELFGIMGSGIGPAAIGKAKQNAIEAAELAVRAGIAALNPFTAWMAPELLHGSEAHAGLALAWAGLGSAFGGNKGDTSVPSASFGGGMGGGVSQNASAASNASNPGVSVTVYVDGIDPTSARHQDLNAELEQQMRERYGDNSKISVIPRRSA